MYWFAFYNTKYKPLLTPVTFSKLKGVAMGTCIGHSYACLFGGYIEQFLFQPYTVWCLT